jgi:hypothetical protein
MADRLESYYANVVDSVGDGVIVLDPLRYFILTSLPNQYTIHL